jgi:hypothetical protein
LHLKAIEVIELQHAPAHPICPLYYCWFIIQNTLKRPLKAERIAGAYRQSYPWHLSHIFQNFFFYQRTNNFFIPLPPS